MLKIYTNDRYLASLKPVSFARSLQFQELFKELLERLHRHNYELGEYCLHEGERLLDALLALHDATFCIKDISQDCELIQMLFTKDLIELNKFVPCEEARKPRPHLKIDPIQERLKVKKSGDRYMDDLADLTEMLSSYEQAIAITEKLSQTEIDHFIFRLSERRRDPAQLVTEENHEFYFNEWMQDDWNKDYVANAFFGTS